MAGIPAFVHNGRFDILHANPLAAALYSEHFRDSVRPPNSARFLFLDPRARAFYADWETAANDIVATLRGEAGRNHTTAPYRISSGCCPPAARSPASAGPTTTCASTGPGPSASTTRWSGT